VGQDAAEFVEILGTAPGAPLAGCVLVLYNGATEGDVAYRAADLVVVPSQGGESFGIVPLEAMAHLRPVVATRIQGYAAWMEDVACLVPPEDPDALAAALVRLAEDPEERRSLAARGGEAARDFDWPQVATRWAKVYERPLPRDPRGL